MNNLSQNPEINISNAIVFSKNPTALEIVQHPHEISSNNYSYILNNQLNCLEYKNKTYSNEKNVKLQKFVNNKNISKMHYFNKIMTNRNSLPNMINMIASKGQQNKESNRNSSPKLSLRNEEEIEEEERFCKICFEQTSNELTSRLIAPCKCSGSVKYIHEECLKTWLVSQNIDLKYANCELCQTSYKMNIEIGSKCLPSSILNMYNLMFLFCLSIFLTCFIVIIIRSALKWNNERNEENNNAALHMAIIVSCSFLTIVDIILIFTTMKEIFMVPFVKKWSILESKKTAIMNLRAKLGKIERKKITPYHCFQLKTPVINNNNQNFQKQFTTIFGKHSKSDNTLLKKNNEKKIFYVNSKIIKISSKKKLILNPVEEVKIQGSEIKKIIMNNDMSLQKVHSQKDLKKRFLDKIPGDFLLNEEEDERILDIMIEVGQKKV